MKKLGRVGMKWLKVIHIILVALSFGGIMSFGQTIVGIFIVDKLMLANMAILESEKAMALVNPEFIQNQTIRQYAIIFQVVITILIFCISVFKPWKKKKLVTYRTATLYVKFAGYFEVEQHVNFAMTWI